MVPGIYMIMNVVQNKVYIGQSSNVAYRMRKHKEMLKGNRHYNVGLQEHWNRFTQEAFVFNILERIDDKSKLNEREEFWTKFYQTNTSCQVYNISIGRKLAESTKLKLREANLGDKNPKYWLGKHRPEETKQKLSEAHKGLQAGEMHPMWGKTGYWKDKSKPVEVKAKISHTLKGHKVSDETRGKISSTKKGISNTKHPLYFEVTEEVLQDVRNGISQKDFVAKYGKSVNTLKRIKRELKLQLITNEHRKSI
jgi:group I intron endonuclease